jgi:2-polyprenyl-6-hydroxyphenyl methylase/3-demethylubiquinone-9 3-methyltransferase
MVESGSSNHKALARQGTSTEDIIMASAAAADVTAGIDADELAKFATLERSWWDPKGPMAPLHKLNPIRIACIRDQACQRFGRDPRAPRPLAGLSALDIGCGGGLLAEPLARLGATVTGVDPVPASIEAARWHAQEVGLEIAYDAVPVEDLVLAGRRFDLVIASEVIEHVPDVPDFLAAMAAVTRPGGLAILSTVSRTTESFLKAIVGAEYVLGWLPRGTHSWRRFVRPAELAQLLRTSGLRPVHLAGMTYDPARDEFALGRDTGTNYVIAAVRDGG